MGDVRFAKYYRQVRDAADPRAELARLDDDGLVAALAATARERDAYVANVVATELLNRNRQSKAITQALGEGVLAVDLEGRLTFLNPAAERMLGWRAEEVLGEGVEVLLGPAPRGDGRSVAYALREHLETRAEAWLRRSDSQLLPALVTTAPILRMDEPIGSVAVFRDQTEERRAEVERAKLLAREREARARAEEAEHRARFLVHATELLTSSLDIESRLNRLAHMVVPELGDWCTVHLLDDEGRLRLRALAHPDAQLADVARTFFDREPIEANPYVRRAMSLGQPVVVEDAAVETMPEPASEDEAAEQEAHHELARRLDLRTVMFLPLKRGDTPMGLLVLATSGRTRRYTSDERELVANVVRVVSAAIENARLYDSERTMRRQAEAAVHALNDALRESRRTRARYEMLLMAASQIVWVLGPTGEAQEDVPSWRAVTGQTAEETRGWGWLDAVHPEDQPRVREVWEAAASSKQPHTTEFRLRTLTGDYRTYVCYAVPVLGPSGALVEWVGACVDITQQRRVEHALREGERKWHALFENASDSMMLIDTQGIVADANASALRTIGRSSEDLVGKPAWSIAVPAQQERARTLVQRHDPGPRLHDTLRVALPDGKTRDLELTVTPDVLPGRHLVSLHNISSRRAAERRAAGFLESVADAFFAVDNSWRFTYVNGQAEKLLHRAREELLGRNVWEEFPEATGTEFHRRYEEAMSQKRTVHFEAHYPPLDTWFEVSAYPSEDGLSIYFRDVSARKGTEAQAERERKELERRVHERTRELESANAELEAFTHSVSHDLRAPLRGIDFYAQVLEEDYAERLDAEGRDTLKRLRSESRRTAQLVRDLLRLSRASREPMARERVDVSALATQVAQEMQRAEPQRTVKVDVEPGMRAFADEALLRVVLENLMSNAWKFTRERGADARITVGRDDEGGFFVRDNGAGFDPSKAEKLFRPFERLHTSQQFEGTGLGLAAVARIVRRHGGDVEADGRPGEGATFRFWLSGNGEAQERSGKE